MTYQIKILRTVDALREIKAAWNELHRAVNGSPFSSYDWQSIWCDTYLNADADLFVVTAWQNETLIAAVPFAIRRTAVTKLKFLRPRHLTMLAPDRVGFHDLLALGGHEDVFDDIISACRSEPGISYADLSPMQSGPAYDAFCKAAAAQNAWIFARDEITTAVADLSGDWDSYISRRSKNRRRSMKRQIRDFDGEVRIAKDGSPASMAVLEDMFKVSAKSWKAVNGTDVGTDTQHRVYIERIYNAFCADGRVFVGVVYIDDTPISSFVNLVGPAGAYGWITDYDDTKTDLGAGALAVLNNVQFAQTEGYLEMDMLRATPFTTTLCDRFPVFHRTRISFKSDPVRWAVQLEQKLTHWAKIYGPKRDRKTGRKLIIGER